MADQTQKCYETIEELVVNIRNSNYNLNEIKQYLASNRIDAERALLKETNESRIKLDSEHGKNLWQTILGNCKLSGLERELDILESDLYRIFRPFDEGSYEWFHAFMCVITPIKSKLRRKWVEEPHEKKRRKYFSKKFGLTY